ncbi:hypothetical protein INT47_008098 [Mucor saturninus]|uniref:Reverse transcriptase domain-containing protein n=1 Tax=Mucor saturninus TaxID=64648 RepID=A0A8H7R2U8_9FUNG|nr:hypothetical protein INT47_008098 [Mucor saturninus]
MNDLISPQQMGFMPSRFIGENGKTLQAVMSIAEHTSSNAIGLLIDQEKAYDRIHPTYLAQMMTKFGIPSQIISSLCTLFFNTKIHININGHLSTPVLQQRGLGQGDPISPLLFNIVFDPFLRSVQQATDFQGFTFPESIAEPSPEPLKIMAYADDTLVFLQTHQDFVCLERLITQYTLASNAKLNFAETLAFSFSGKTSRYLTRYLNSRETLITSWHDRHSPNALTYLGYPLYFNASQKNLAIDLLIQKYNMDVIFILNVIYQSKTES